VAEGENVDNNGGDDRGAEWGGGGGMRWPVYT